MGYNHPDILKSNPYYDDFEDTKNFLKMLFKPGYAVQARELTQLQSLLQNQIAKFGSHIFDDGSQVFGGGITLKDANFLRTTVSFADSNIPSYKELINKVIYQTSTQTRAKVIDAFPSVTSDKYVILILQYLTGSSFAANNLILVENYSTATRITVPTSTNNLTDVSGVCQVMSVDSGIFYTDGYFVNSTPQLVTLNITRDGVRYFRDLILTSEGVNNRIGFEINRSIVTFEEDDTLVDPARGFYNYNAPGADRYRIDLTLVTQEFDPQSVEPGEFVTKDFIELSRVVYGVLDYVKKIPTYSELLDTLARRTYDESGNYTVRAFELEVKNHYRDDTYSIFVKLNSGASDDFYSGDHLVTKLNGRRTRIGEIVSYEEYTPTSEEINAGNLSSLPTHVINVKRKKNYLGTYNYPFFTTSPTDNQNIVFYSNVDFTNEYELGVVLRVTATRDPDGVYSPEEGGVDDKFVLSIKPGKAYVFGYEFETINNTNIVVNKEREESVVFVNDYNVGSNIGNYFLVTAPFNNWDGTINIEDLPYIKFGGRYIRITIPLQEEDKRTGTFKYWSPLVADQDKETYRSVGFITKEEALDTESLAGHSDPNDENYLDLIDFNGEEASTEDSSDVGFIRPQNTDRDIAKYLGGGTTKVSYQMVNMSNSVETEISRFVFTDPWHGNMETAYDLSSEQSTNKNASTYTDQVFKVKQIKCLDTANPSLIQVTTGNALRWVPASETGASSSSGSTLFVKVTESIRYDGSTETGNAHFSIDDGVVFTDPASTTNPISYGTSIAYIIREPDVKKVLVKPNGSLGCNAAGVCSPDGQGGFFSVGDVVYQNYTKDGIEVQAVGEVLAVGGDFALPVLGNDGVELYIQHSGVYQIYGANDPEIESLNITNLGCIVGPCGIYLPRYSSTTLDCGGTGGSNEKSCGELIRIGFKDYQDVGDYTIGETAFQYNYLALQEDTSNIPRYNINDLVKGTIISWNKNIKELVVLENQGRFEKYNGTVYQLLSGTAGDVYYGGRGWDYFKTKYANDDDATIGVSLYDIEKVSGIFIDIQDTVDDGNYTETSASVFDYNLARKGESAVQIAVPNIDNYYGEDFAVNDTIYQNINNSVALGKVLSFTHRDLTNPTDESDTVIIIQPTNDVEFVVGPGATNLRSLTNSALFFDVSSSNTRKTKEIIGCGRLRLLKKQDSTLYQAFFFDIKMDYLPDLSRKYNLNEVSQFFYEQSFANAIINNFEDEDIQLSSTTLENQYIFEVDPLYGIDVPLSQGFIKYSKIFEPNLNTLLFSVPGSTAIKSMGELDYRIQQQYTLDSLEDFTSNTLIFNSNDPYTRFIGGESSTTGKVDANDLQEHYICIINDEIINLSSSDYVVTTNNYSSPTSNSILTIKKSDNSLWNNISYVHLIANLNANPKPATTNPFSNQSVSGDIRIKLPKRFKETVTLKKTKSGMWKALLSYADVFSIDKITLVSSNEDIKSQFVLNTGQTDNLYDFGQITLKNEFLVDDVPADTQVIVSYRYFQHTGNGPITVNSYTSSIEYDEIPYYTSPSTGKTIKLDSVIDMRPLKIKSGSTSSIIKKWLPAPATSFNADYDYYLSRAYKLAITRDLKFKLTPGTPGFIPELPLDDDNSMTIYDIFTAPYVNSKNDVVATMVNNRRYTMKDIIELDNRIQVLEQYTILNSLEKEVEAKPIVDPSTQLQRIKSSVFVDNFASHGRCDTLNSQYNACIDPEANTLRPPFKMDNIELDLRNTTNSNIVRTDDNVIMLSYEETPLITQYSVSGTQIINEFNDISWIGSIKITPSSDSWFDVEEKPDVRENENGVNDAIENVTPSEVNNFNNGFGMEWNFWKRKWFGKTEKKNKYSKTTRLLKTNNRSTDAKIDLPVCDFRPPNLISTGQSKTVDKSVIPFAREKEITAIVTGMKPLTEVYVFLDDVNITTQCQIVNNDGKLIAGKSLKTSDFGSLQFKFSIAKRQFKSGELLLVVTDSSANDSTAATTIAEVTYIASGNLGLDGNGFVGLRKPVKNPSSYSKNISDPLAQTFFVDEKKYPQGIFVSSIDLFFASKDNKLPVTVELRSTNNNYPSTREQTLIYPFASKTLYPSNIKVSDSPNSSVEDSKTKFTFTTPVHLLPGEHSIVIKTNSNNYSIYSSEFGQPLLDSDGRIVRLANIGSFFKSQNAGKWEKNDNINMMFGVNRCEFTTDGGSISIFDVDDVSLNDRSFHSYMVNNEEIKFNNTTIDYKIKTVPYTSSVLPNEYAKITPNTNTKLPITNKVLYNGSSFELKIDIGSSDSSISPMFDLDRLNTIIAENIIENNTTIAKNNDKYNGELDPITPVIAEEIARTRYITKIIELEKDFESTNVNVILSVNIPQDTKIQVFLKQQSVGKDSIFDEEPYILLTANKPDYISPDEDTFGEVIYSLPEDLEQPFEKYAIKICMYSANTAIVPKIKELRVVSLV